MPIETPCLRNTMAIGLLSSGQFTEAIAELKGALASVKSALDSREQASDDDLQLTNVAMKHIGCALIPKLVHRAGFKNDHYIVPMFNKVFEVVDNFDDGNLLAAVLLYNLAGAYSMEQHECSDSAHTMKLYRYSLQILHDSGLMLDPRTNLLLMALYNNIAHVAFCDHLIHYAEEALRELSLMLVESVKNDRKGEDFEFFKSNSLLWVNEISLATSPAA